MIGFKTKKSKEMKAFPSLSTQCDYQAMPPTLTPVANWLNFPFLFLRENDHCGVPGEKLTGHGLFKKNWGNFSQCFNRTLQMIFSSPAEFQLIWLKLHGFVPQLPKHYHGPSVFAEPPHRIVNATSVDLASGPPSSMQTLAALLVAGPMEWSWIASANIRLNTLIILSKAEGGSEGCICFCFSRQLLV